MMKMLKICNISDYKFNAPGARPAARNALLAATPGCAGNVKRWSGHDRRSLIETKMRCFKLLGKHAMARDFDRHVPSYRFEPRSSTGLLDWAGPRLCSDNVVSCAKVLGIKNFGNYVTKPRQANMHTVGLYFVRGDVEQFRQD